MTDMIDDIFMGWLLLAAIALVKVAHGYRRKTDLVRSRRECVPLTQGGLSGGAGNRLIGSNCLPHTDEKERRLWNVERRRCFAC